MPLCVAGSDKNTISKDYKGKEKLMAILDGKKVIVIGDRDGIPGPAIAECAKTA